MFDHVYDVSIKKFKDKGYLFKLTKSLIELKGAGYFVENFGLAMKPGGKKKNIA